MVKLTLRVERSASGLRLVFHQADIDASGVTVALSEVESGTYVQADCEYVAGVGMRAVRILAVTAQAQPSPRTSIRALVDKREFARALAELATLDDARLRMDTTLLIARTAARIGQGDEAGAIQDLRDMLHQPGIPSLDIREAIERFSEKFGPTAMEPLSHDFVTWLEVRRPARAISFLSSVSPSLWPLDLLLAALSESIESDPPDASRVQSLLEAARTAASHDPRVSALWARAAARGLTTGHLSETPGVT